ncbi:2'-5' RNA ligase family protein [Pseudonocardia hispaniensis]|uniref:2'-5' RNA ligase family protein n=1 Tax=Pseudonocardia hispaniensis TaxID=904933 RepID=A0ABW1IZA8_9PSEU
MSHAVRFRLDDDAVAELTALRERLHAAGIPAPTARPAVTFAAAATIPPAARAALIDELRVLTLPALWLATLGTIAGHDDELVLAAIVDAELLAVHAAVHDALAGRVRAPVAAYLPGAWLPHCTLAHERPAEAFALLHPFRPVRAGVSGVELVDTRTGTAEPIT